MADSQKAYPKVFLISRVVLHGNVEDMEHALNTVHDRRSGLFCYWLDRREDTHGQKETIQFPEYTLGTGVLFHEPLNLAQELQDTRQCLGNFQPTTDPLQSARPARLPSSEPRRYCA
jgi:hypothetical protein